MNLDWLPVPRTGYDLQFTIVDFSIVMNLPDNFLNPGSPLTNTEFNQFDTSHCLLQHGHRNLTVFSIKLMKEKNVDNEMNKNKDRHILAISF